MDIIQQDACQLDFYLCSALGRLVTLSTDGCKCMGMIAAAQFMLIYEQHLHAPLGLSPHKLLVLIM
jgi:hypothetical protein